VAEPALTWLGATFGLLGPGWQGSFRLAGDREPSTVVVWLDAPTTDAIARRLGQPKLEKRQAELILQHAGRELIEAALEAFELPERVDIETTAATLEDDLRRWRVLR
jgi:hypothetical protein